MPRSKYVSTKSIGMALEEIAEGFITIKTEDEE
jgi:DNA-directed RNA polymerase subunit K/omega